MRLQPYEHVDGIPFTVTRQDALRRYGQPISETCNAVDLTELDYGNRVLRFQQSGRLEEVTVRAPVLDLGNVSIPFFSLGEFVHRQDGQAFERAGFLISPLLGMAFVPHQPSWVTALARHCLPDWQALPI